MPLYKYVAVDNNGKSYRGTLEADTIEEFHIKLKDKGLLLIDYSKVTSKKSPSLFSFRRKAKVDELIQLFNSIGNMLESGVSLVESLKYVKRTLDREIAKNTVDNMIRILERGGSFSQAIKGNKDFFPEFVVEPIETGEVTGNLPRVLLMMSEQLEKNKKIKDKLKKASIYPGFVITALIILITIVINFVFPRILKSIQEINVGHDYPPITKFILGIVNKLQVIGPFIPIIFVVFIFFFLLRRKILPLKSFFDSIQMKIPYLKDIILFRELISFLQVLVIGVRSGVSLIYSLTNAENNIDNIVIKEKISRAKLAVSMGETLSSGLKEVDIHPYLEAMVVTGETTGTLDKALENALYYFNSRVEEKIDRFFAWLEPIIILILGSVVLSVLLCSLLPMWESLSALKTL